MNLNILSTTHFYTIPITPHATRPPALPVFFESGCIPLPKSSIAECTTTERPITLRVPIKRITLSVKLVEAYPSLFAITLPRSPT